VGRGRSKVFGEVKKDGGQTEMATKSQTAVKQRWQQKTKSRKRDVVSSTRVAELLPVKAENTRLTSVTRHNQ
jgi:hypothetical protein